MQRGELWPVDVLQWMYLIQSPKEREQTIAGYLEVIAEIEKEAA